MSIRKQRQSPYGSSRMAHLRKVVEADEPRCPRYTLQAGRSILRDGKPFITIEREGTTRPVDADAAARKIVKMLNQACTIAR